MASSYHVAVGEVDPASCERAGRSAYCGVAVPAVESPDGVHNGHWVCTLARGHGGSWHVAHVDMRVLDTLYIGEAVSEGL